MIIPTKPTDSGSVYYFSQRFKTNLAILGIAFAAIALIATAFATPSFITPHYFFHHLSLLTPYGTAAMGSGAFVLLCISIIYLHNQRNNNIPHMDNETDNPPPPKNEEDNQSHLKNQEENPPPPPPTKIEQNNQSHLKNQEENPPPPPPTKIEQNNQSPLKNQEENPPPPPPTKIEQNNQSHLKNQEENPPPPPPTKIEQNNQSHLKNQEENPPPPPPTKIEQNNQPPPKNHEENLPPPPPTKIEQNNQPPPKNHEENLPPPPPENEQNNQPPLKKEIVSNKEKIIEINDQPHQVIQSFTTQPKYIIFKIFQYLNIKDISSCMLTSKKCKEFADSFIKLLRTGSWVIDRAMAKKFLSDGEQKFNEQKFDLEWKKIPEGFGIKVYDDITTLNISFNIVQGSFQKYIKPTENKPSTKEKLIGNFKGCSFYQSSENPSSIQIYHKEGDRNLIKSFSLEELSVPEKDLKELQIPVVRFWIFDNNLILAIHNKVSYYKHFLYCWCLDNMVPSKSNSTYPCPMPPYYSSGKQECNLVNIFYLSKNKLILERFRGKTSFYLLNINNDKPLIHNDENNNSLKKSEFEKISLKHIDPLNGANTILICKWGIIQMTTSLPSYSECLKFYIECIKFDENFSNYKTKQLREHPEWPHIDLFGDKLLIRTDTDQEGSHIEILSLKELFDF